MLTYIRKLWDHSVWADQKLLDAIPREKAPTQVWREFAHIVGANEIWLSRLERRPSRVGVWPDLTPSEVAEWCGKLHGEMSAYVGTVTDEMLSRLLPYATTTGQSFETPIGDLLVHVPMHAHYHRGKINLLLRQGGLEPVAADFIFYVRGVPAAVTPPR